MNDGRWRYTLCGWWNVAQGQREDKLWPPMQTVGLKDPWVRKKEYPQGCESQDSVDRDALKGKEVTSR